MSFDADSEINSTERTTNVTGRQTKQLELDEEATQKLITDLLSGAGGLAEIFGGEQTAGIFNSSVSAQAAGDLSARIVGELAKITGREVVEQESRERVKEVGKGFSSGAEFSLF